MQKTVKKIGKRVQHTALVSILALFSLSVHAAPLVWYLSGFTFTDGGTASGSFTYDADTGTYSAISITTTAGTTIPTGNSYNVTVAAIGCGTPEVVCMLNSADGPDYIGDLGLTIAHVGTPLTNDGGTIALTFAREYTCENSSCSSVVFPQRLLSTGSITTNPAASTYSVGGSVSGLTGTGLELQNNSSDTLAIAANGPFAFVTELADLSDYLVTVLAQPTDQTCTVTNGNGSIDGADITSVAVTCEDNVVPPPPSDTPVPMLSQWALILFAILIVCMVFANRRRLF